MNILLVEDSSGFALPIKTELEARGYLVVWVIGAVRVLDSKLVGILAHPGAQPFSDSWDNDSSRLDEVNLREVNLALVDGGLVGPINSGEAIVPHLVANKILCIAITGGGAGNTVLMSAGAHMGLPKEFVVVALRKGALNPAVAIKRPKVAARRLVAFTAKMRSRLVRSNARGRRIALGIPVLDNTP
jgi:hypothetical protein